jgi:hypothetical protein
MRTKRVNKRKVMKIKLKLSEKIIQKENEESK